MTKNPQVADFKVITEGQVEQGSRKNLLLNQKQCNQQAPNATIAIQERMYGLELVVGQGNGHQWWQLGRVEEFLPSRETRLDLTGRRRNEGSGSSILRGQGDRHQEEAANVKTAWVVRFNIYSSTKSQRRLDSCAALNSYRNE